MTAFLPPPYDGLTTTQVLAIIGVIILAGVLYAILRRGVKR